MTTKSCPGAGIPAHVEAVDLFASDKSRIDGKAPYCKICAAVKQKEWKKRNPEKVRAAQAKYRKRPLEPTLA
jgi:hypothetical protein